MKKKENPALCVGFRGRMGGWGGGEEAIMRRCNQTWSSREDIKILFFYSHNCQLWFLWMLLRRKLSCKQHFQLSTQPEIRNSTPPTAATPPISIHPEKSRTAGKARETKGEMGAHPRAIDCVFVYLVRSERGDHVSAPIGADYRGETRGCMNQGV